MNNLKKEKKNGILKRENFNLFLISYALTSCLARNTGSPLVYLVAG